MKVADLVQQRRAGWAELEALCVTLEKRGARRTKFSSILRFATVYRDACADLALAEAYHLPPDTIQYLHQLVGRAHNQLYRSQLFRLRAWTTELLSETPRRLLRDRALWLAMAIFWGVFFSSMALGYRSRTFSEQVVGAETLDSLEDAYAEPHQGKAIDDSSLAGGFYVIHNTGIGLRCFAAGLLLGVGGLFITVSNALQLGAMFGHMMTVESRNNFFEFVTAHGPFELTAIVFAAAAGMRMGFSVVATGGRTRASSLRSAAAAATSTMAVSALLFFSAAFLEGFLSPSAAPYFVKASAAVFSTLILIFYLIVMGWWRRGPRAA